MAAGSLSQDDGRGDRRGQAAQGHEPEVGQKHSVAYRRLAMGKISNFLGHCDKSTEVG